MQARITSGGALQVRRAGQWKTQYCPPEGHVFCGHWCPRFEECHGTVAACGVPFVVEKDLRKKEE